HEQRRIHRPGLTLGQVVALVVTAPRIGGVGRLLAGQRVDGVDVRVRVDREHNVGIRAQRKPKVRWEIGHLAQQAGVQKHQMTPVADPEVAISTRSRHEKAGPTWDPVAHACDRVDGPSIERKQEEVLESRWSTPPKERLVVDAITGDDRVVAKPAYEKWNRREVFDMDTVEILPV